MGKLEHYSIGKRNLSAINHWEELNSETFRITKPTVLCFGGNMSLKPRDANYMCRVAQNLVGIKEPHFKNELGTTRDVDFVGIGYGDDETIGFGKNQKISPTSSLTDEEIIELANNIFTPLYFNEMMQKRSKEEILRNFNQITFFSHCYGAAEICVLIRQVSKNMLAVGFDKQTIEEAIGQLYSVSYAPWQIIPCPGLQVIPEKDRTIFGGPSRAKISQEFLANRHLYSGTGTVAFKENDYLVSLITSDITPTAEDEHPISYIERDNNWHMLEPTVTYGEEVSQAISVALSYSIANSIHNHNNPLFTPRPDSDKTLSRIQSILGSTQNANFTQAIEQIKEI